MKLFRDRDAPEQKLVILFFQVLTATDVGGICLPRPASVLAYVCTYIYMYIRTYVYIYRYICMYVCVSCHLGVQIEVRRVGPML